MVFFIFIEVSNGMRLIPKANRYVTFIDATNSIGTPKSEKSR